MKRSRLCVSETEDSCVTAAMAPIAPPQNVGAALLFQHLQPNHYGSPPHHDHGLPLLPLAPFESDSPPVHGYQGISTVDFEQIQVKTEVNV